MGKTGQGQDNEEPQIDVPQLGMWSSRTRTPQGYAHRSRRLGISVQHGRVPGSSASPDAISGWSIRDTQAMVFHRAMIALNTTSSQSEWISNRHRVDTASTLRAKRVMYCMPPAIGDKLSTGCSGGGICLKAGRGRCDLHTLLRSLRGCTIGKTSYGAV